jgi:two-component system cell cycle response regulator CtrA
MMDKCAVLDAADQRTNASQVRTGKVLINLDDRPVHLTGKEYGILELLSLRKGTILTKEMLLDHLYGGMDEPALKIIDVLVCKLRKKLAQATGGNHYIETVWGRGYVLRELTHHLVADSPSRQVPATEVVQRLPSAG